MTRADDLPDSKVWIASGNVRIPLTDMSETHLRNATKYMQKAIVDGMHEDETEMEEMAARLFKLEGEIERRSTTPGGKSHFQSIPITASMQQAADNYRKMMGERA